MRPTRADLTERKLRAGARSLVRRLRVAASKGVLWALEGHEDLDGNVEKDAVEVFPNVGLYARAKAGHRVEAVVLKVGSDSGHPVIVATRNQDGIRALGDLDEDETAIFTSQSVVKIKADGSIEIGAIGGAMEPTIKGTTYRAAEDAMLAAVSAAFSALTAGPITVPGAAATAAAATAIDAFKLPASAPSYLTTKLKAQ